MLKIPTYQAHRAIITRGLKSLDGVVQLVLTSFELTEKGWLFTGKDSSPSQEPLYGFKSLSELYYKADPEFNGRFTVPLLWDKKTETVVNNESSEIIRMFYSEFDAFLAEPLRETNTPNGGFYPPHLRAEIDEMNDWVYNTVNNGVYKCGFSTTQQAYDSNVYPLFASLDRLEQHLSQSGHSPYLFGAHITEADIRLYTTMARFDVAYFTIFQCNLKMIRHDYPRLHLWLRNLYWDTSDRTNGGVFHRTTYFDVFKYGYARAKEMKYHQKSDGAYEIILPAGPKPDMQPLTDRELETIERQFLAADPSVVNHLASRMEGSGLVGQAEFESQTHDHDDLSHRNGADGTTASQGNKSWPEEEELEQLEGKKAIARRTTYSEENKKWEKQIKKATKGEPPAVHLALS